MGGRESLTVRNRCWPGLAHCRLSAAASPLPETVLLQVTHLDQILLNGNNIAVLVPGGKPEGQ